MRFLKLSLNYLLIELSSEHICYLYHPKLEKFNKFLILLYFAFLIIFAESSSTIYLLTPKVLLNLILIKHLRYNLI